MIVSLIRDAAERRGIRTAYQLQIALNISPTGAARLWRGDFDRIGLVTLDKLCQVLECTPGQLFRYEPSKTNKSK
jgi:DNA-binding Xre family transcriptional regulator